LSKLVGSFGIFVLLAHGCFVLIGPLAGRIVAGLSSAYLVLLAVAWLAMSGKWG